MSNGSKKKSRFRVGDRVTFEFGTHTVVATVIEDRGYIGAGGRQLLRVRLPVEETDEFREFEVPAEEVKSAA
jgi:hypothetical protein